MEAHGTSREFGGFLSSMLTLFAMIATPLFGFVVDRIGKRALLMMFGSLLLIPVYLMMAYYPGNLYMPDGDDGSRLFADSGRDVAIGGLHRRAVEAGNGLWPDDHDPEHRPLWPQPADRLGERLRSRGASNPAAISSGCGSSRFSASWDWPSRSCFASGKRVRTGTDLETITDREETSQVET